MVFRESLVHFLLLFRSEAFLMHFILSRHVHSRRECAFTLQWWCGAPYLREMTGVLLQTVLEPTVRWEFLARDVRQRRGECAVGLVALQGGNGLTIAGNRLSETLVYRCTRARGEF